MYTWHSSPKNRQAMLIDVPHWPAPVSVVSRRMPASLLQKAWGMAVFSLWLPAGLTPSYLQ